MKRILIAVSLAVFLLGACAVRTRYRGEAVIVPALPSIVVLEEEPYYYQGGYYYYYHDNRWSYSHSRSGPWMELPRDRYPNETRFKGRGEDRGRGEKRGHDERGHDER